jgi:hypothetical protein
MLVLCHKSPRSAIETYLHCSLVRYQIDVMASLLTDDIPVAYLSDAAPLPISPVSGVVASFHSMEILRTPSSSDEEWIERRLTNSTADSHTSITLPPPHLTLQMKTIHRCPECRSRCDQKPYLLHASHNVDPSCRSTVSSFNDNGIIPMKLLMPTI